MAVADSESFRGHAIGYWTRIDQGDYDGATAHTEALEEVAPLLSAGDLQALLADADERVRYAAAATLGPGDETAVATLQSLGSEPTGLVAPTANLLLQTWGRP